MSNSIKSKILFTLWLFNSVMLRMLVLTEVYVFLVMMPLLPHFGVTIGYDVTLVYSHRLAFMLGLPAVSVIHSFVLSRFLGPSKTLSGWRNVLLHSGMGVTASTAASFAMAALFPESVHVEAFYAPIAGVILTAGAWFVAWLLSKSYYAQVPTFTATER